MSKTQAMWIKIKESMVEGFPQTKAQTALYVLRGARIHHHLTSLIVILQKRSQSLKENNSEGFCVIAHSPNTAWPKIEFDVQDESKLLLFSAFLQRKQPSGSLRPVQSNCPQLFPTPPLFLLSLFQSSSLAVKESAAVWSPLG